MIEPTGDGWHYLRQNDATRYPRRIICLDSEAAITATENGERHDFMLACASFDRWSTGYESQEDGDYLETMDYRELWSWIDSYCKKRERTVLFAHNLGYDLRLTQALKVLPERGWDLSFISVDSDRCFARFNRNSATLALSDSASFLPVPLERIATILGLEKVPLPDMADAPDKWFERCRRDVEILRQAMFHVLKWLEVNDCGNWRPTGPAQSFACYRHRFMEKRSILIHREPEALAAERRAGWTGRAEVWKHGEFDHVLHEWDFKLAYAHIAAHSDLPSRYIGTSELDGRELHVPTRQGYAMLYDVTVETERPTVPTMLGEFMVWPTGRFETTLWDCEIELAKQYGARVYAHRSWRYRKAPVLQSWADWIIRELGIRANEADELTQVMLKHWARCLIGRFGIRYPKWERIGESKKSELAFFDCYSADGEDDTKFLQVSNSWFELSGVEEGSDSAPAIMSYIMALSRVQLWDAIQAAGEDELYYCDTDSLIVTTRGSKRLDDYSRNLVGAALLHKGVYQHGIFYAPRAIVLDDQPRIAGLSKRAERTGNLHYRARVWQRLSDSLRIGDATGIRIWERPFHILLRDTRRVHNPNQETVPYALPVS